jgi:hypothetical protein
MSAPRLCPPICLIFLACATSGPTGGGDAGPQQGPDAGVVDAGGDAGSVDAGLDAGPSDAGGGGDDGGVRGLGDPCVPGTPDPCAVHGLVCNAGSCALPEEMGCTTTNDCFDPTAICIPVGDHRSCVPDFCGPGTTDGAYYAPCANQGPGDGTCLPGVGGAFGLCLIHGTAPLGSACGDRTTSLQQLCGAGALCAEVEGGLLALCAPVCYLHARTGPACQAGFTCFDGPIVIELGYNIEVGSGYCLQDCGGGQACPAPLLCSSFSDANGPHTECLPTP